MRRPNAVTPGEAGSPLLGAADLHRYAVVAKALSKVRVKQSMHDSLLVDRKRVGTPTALFDPGKLKSKKPKASADASPAAAPTPARPANPAGPKPPRGYGARWSKKGVSGIRQANYPKQPRQLAKESSSDDEEDDEGAPKPDKGDWVLEMRE